MTLRLFLIFALTTQLISSVGCSTVGLTLWPSQMPMLTKAKQIASASRTHAGMNSELSKQALVDYFIEPGDRLLLEPADLDSSFRSTGDQQVLIDGSIDLGDFGRVRVAGMTVEMVEQQIAERIKEVLGSSEQINVQLTETNASKVYVLGAVGSPGSYELEGRETVLDAILLAGGLTSKASPCNIVLVRPTGPCECRFVQRICYRQITQLGDTTTNYQLQPGDRIVVAERTFWEEAAIWKQATTCSCCDNSDCGEKHPEMVNYHNRFAGILPPFPKPESEQDKPQKSQAVVPDSAVDNTPVVQEVEDQKFFIPQETGEN